MTPAGGGKALAKRAIEKAGCSDLACLKAQPVANMSKDVFEDFAGQAHGHFSKTYDTSFVVADGEVFKKPLFDAICAGESIGSGDKPLIAGTGVNEWSYFEVVQGSDFGVNFVKKWLADFQPGFATASSTKQDQAVSKLLEVFKDVNLEDCYMCAGFPNKAMTHLVTEVTFTVPSNLWVSGKGSGTKYRSFVDIAGTGSAFGGTHSFYMGQMIPFVDPAKAGEEYKAKRGINPNGDKLTEEQKTLAKMGRQYWANFAKNGVPTSEVGPTWNPVSDGLTGDPAMHLSVTEPKMGETYWSEATAALMSQITCGKLDVDTLISTDVKTLLDS